MKIDPQRVGHMPEVESARPFQSQDGRFQGWKVTLPVQRPLATPAVVDGRVFLDSRNVRHSIGLSAADEGDQPMHPRVIQVLIVVLMFVQACYAQAEHDRDIRQSVVRVIVTQRWPDLLQPWQRQAPERVSGSGAVIEGNRIITSAHLVMYATQVDVQPFQAADMLPAKVTGLAPEMDLALLEIDDGEFFKTHPPLVMHDELPAVNATVTSYGYPIGGVGLSVTQGRVSRIEFGTYGYGQSGLRVEISAAANPGDSGGPATVNGRMVGLVFGVAVAGQNTAYVIPTEEISYFLNDIRDGHYDGKPDFHEEIQSLQNRALRDWLRLPRRATGVLVREPYENDAGYPLKKGDVISAIGPFPIDNAGMVRVDDNLRLAFPYLLPKLAQQHKVPLTIVRDGKQLVVDLPTDRQDRSLLRYLKGGEPSYFIWGPMAFSAATGDLVDALETLAPYLPTVWAIRNSPLAHRRNGTMSYEGEELVVVTAMFPHRIGDGYANPTGQVVSHVSGIPIRNLRHMAEALRDTKEQYVEIEFAEKYVETLVFDRAQAVRATEQILADNGIREQFSSDLRDCLGPIKVDDGR